MTTTPPHIERLTPKDFDEAKRALTESFLNQPPYTMLYTKQHTISTEVTMGFILTQTFKYGLVEATRDSEGIIDGVATWIPPEISPLKTQHFWVGVPQILRNLINLRRALPNIYRVLDFGSFLEQFHPGEPHWYLYTLGVRANRQGHGQGSALVRHRLNEIDQQGVAAYLDTQKEANVSYYKKFGFAVTHGPKIAKNGIPVWCMLRSA